MYYVVDEFGNLIDQNLSPEEALMYVEASKGDYTIYPEKDD